MEDYAGKLEVYVYHGKYCEITESERVKQIALKMWDKSCDIFNDVPGLLSVLNDIWDVRHPNEMPNHSKELQSEYDRLHERMCDDVWEALSWSEGVDLDNKKRYVLLNCPYFSEYSRVWKISLSVKDL